MVGFAVHFGVSPTPPSADDRVCTRSMRHVWGLCPRYSRGPLGSRASGTRPIKPVRGIERDLDARIMGWIFGQNLDRIGNPSVFCHAETMSSKMAHTTDFLLATRPSLRPL